MKGTDQTKSDILEAFWRLYAQKPLDKITIRELTEVAGYNRGTFYLHYQDIYDLFESEKSRLLAEMEECVAYCSGNMGKIELIKLMMHVLALYERNRTQIVLLLGERGDPAFMKKLRGMMKQIPLWKASDPNLKVSPGERDLLLEQNIAGVLFLIEAWLEDPRGVTRMQLPSPTEHMPSLAPARDAPLNQVDNRIKRHTQSSHGDDPREHTGIVHQRPRLHDEITQAR